MQAALTSRFAVYTVVAVGKAPQQFFCFSAPSRASAAQTAEITITESQDLWAHEDLEHLKNATPEPNVGVFITEASPYLWDNVIMPRGFGLEETLTEAKEGSEGRL